MKIITSVRIVSFLAPVPATALLLQVLANSQDIWKTKMLVAGFRRVGWVIASEYTIRSIWFYCGIFYATYILKGTIIDYFYGGFEYTIELRIALIVIRFAAVGLLYWVAYNIVNSFVKVHCF